jgi:hypothetical protein
MLPDDNLPNQILPMILIRMKEHLETAAILEVPDTNPTRAKLVKIGRFQENPINVNVSISISSGDYEDPEYMDGRIDNPDLDDVVIKNLPVGEIGGGIYWWRRGTINHQAFFVRQRFEEEVAMKYAYDFHGRLILAVEQCPLSGLVDDYGEKVYPKVFVEGSTFFESGGSKQFIWRGKLKWRCLTWRPSGG